jgi:hypothetical protein
MEHEEAGRGIRKGSQYQMYLMINLRVRVQFLRDMASHWMDENASDEQKIRDLEKEMGPDQDVLENCEDAEREQKSSLHEVQGKAKTLDEVIGLSNYEEKNGTEVSSFVSAAGLAEQQNSNYKNAKKQRQSPVHHHTLPARRSSDYRWGHWK